MAIVTVGIDLAKNVFAVHGVGPSGKPEFVRPEVRRSKLLELVASLPPCLIGMETCSGAHHWAREFEKHGHKVRLMAPKFVAPYRMSGKLGKNDANDAAAICEAVTLCVRVNPVSAEFRLRKHVRGRKDRYAMLSPVLLERLRVWWRVVWPVPKARCLITAGCFRPINFVNLSGETNGYN